MAAATSRPPLLESETIMPVDDGDNAANAGEWTVVTSGSRHGKRRGARGGSYGGGLQQQKQRRSKALPAWHQSALRCDRCIRIEWNVGSAIM